MHPIADDDTLPGWLRLTLVVAGATALIAAVVIFVRPWLKTFTSGSSDGEM